jgi:membrane-associated protease RseP (regulator of RpoE activity)
VPLLVLGLALSDQVVPLSSRDLTLERLGSSLLIDALVRLFTDLPPGSTLRLHPVLYAAWLGFFLTGINLLPVGQLDGGHAAYALLGRYAHYLGIAVFVGLLIAGTLLSPNWYVWAFFIMLGGLRHPPPLNDVTRLGPGRQMVGLFSILLFVLIVTPAPFGN